MNEHHEYVAKEAVLILCEYWKNKFCECEYAYRPLIKDIKNMCASDVKPIIYAEWVLINNPNYSPFDRSEEYVYQCTNCKTIQDYHTLFCSHCGADMRSSKI